MKLLLTSAGIRNRSIHDALLELLGTPIADSVALCIPTAGYGDPQGDRPANAWQFISANEPRCPMCGSPMGKSPLGQTALRGVESLAKQMHQAKLQPGATTAKRQGY